MQKKNTFKKNLIRSDIDINKLINKENKINLFKRTDFDNFLFKFYGNFIFKGKKSYSFKIYDYILFNLKYNLKDNPTKIFLKIIKILMPFLILGKKKFKGKLVHIPVLAKNKNKNIFMINSLIKQFKGRSYTNGINKSDVLKILIDTFNLKGSAINLKKDHYIEVLKNRKNIKPNFNNYSILNEWKLKKKKIKKINKFQKDEEEEKIEDDIFIDNLKKYNITPSIELHKKIYKLKKKNGIKYTKRI